MDLREPIKTFKGDTHMTIKEVEEMLGIPRATIRFYEKERLIDPKREENGYREYSEQDVATLKKVVLFRKLGLAVSDIEEILDGTLPLTEALSANVSKLEQQLAELNGAIEMSRAILKTNPDIDTLDGEFYYEEGEREEARGSRFMDIAKDMVSYQKSVFLDYYGLSDAEGGLRMHPAAAVVSVISASLIWGVCRLLLIEKSLHSFLIGVATPLLTRCFWSAIRFTAWRRSIRNSESTRRRPDLRCFALLFSLCWCFLIFVIGSGGKHSEVIRAY